MKTTANILVSTWLVSLSLGCSSAPSAPVGKVSPELLNAPAEIVVQNATLRLEIYPYRNFQPGTSVDTRLIAGFTIVVGAGSFPIGLRAERAWLVRNAEAWNSTPTAQPEISTPDQMKYVSRKGPEWPVGDLVIGVLQLRDARNNSYLLRSASQTIGRAD